MDTALANGDFALGSNGRVKQVGGMQELLQRAMIRLNVPLGSFVYDPALGSQLHTLKINDANFSAKGIVLAQEALRQLTQFTVEGVRCCEAEPPTIAVTLSYGGNTAEIEVKL